MKKIFTTSLILTLIYPSILSASMDSANYQIWADVISTGGVEDSSSSNYELRETAGESGIGRSSSTDYTVRAGFRELTKDMLTLSVGSGSVSMGNLSTGSSQISSHTLTIYTNSASGISVTYTGNTLTCGSCSGTNYINGIGAAAASSAPGTSQFGLNAAYASGSTDASSQAPYNSVSQYAFNSGDQIIGSATGMDDQTVFNINYLANISGQETAGNYTASLTFTATANF